MYATFFVIFGFTVIFVFNPLMNDTISKSTVDPLYPLTHIGDIFVQFVSGLFLIIILSFLIPFIILVIMAFLSKDPSLKNQFQNELVSKYTAVLDASQFNPKK